MKKKVVSILLALSMLCGVAVDAVHAEEVVQDGANTTASVATYLDTRPKDLSGLILTIPSEIELTARMASGKLAAYQAEDYISATGQLNGEYSLQVYVPEYNYMDINRSNYENYKRPNFYFKTKPDFNDSGTVDITTFDNVVTKYSQCRYQYWDADTLLTGTKESNKKDFVLEFHDSGTGVTGWGDLTNKFLKGTVNFKVSTERKTPRRVVTAWTDGKTYTIDNTNFLNTVDKNGYMKVGGVAYKADADEDCYMLRTYYYDTPSGFGAGVRSRIPEITSDKLKYLKLSDLFYEISTDSRANMQIKDCPNLETLEYSIRSTNNGFVITNCPNLKKVYMYGADRKEFVHPLWKQCSSITDIYVPNLIISEVKNVTNIATASGVTFHCLDGNYTVE